MALTVLTAANQTLGPVLINRDRPFAYRVAGTLTAGSTVVLETSRLDEDTYSTVQTFAAATTPVAEHYMATRGWKFRLRCATFTGPDTPSGEIICL